jgi:hypothetical protein
MAHTGTDWVKVASALSKPLTKLIEVASNGIGALGQPFVVLLNAHSTGMARLIRQGYDHRLRKLREKHRVELLAAQQSKPFPALPVATEPAPEEIEVVFDDAEPSETIATVLLETEQQAKRRANVVTVIAEAAEQLSDAKDASDEAVDPDWIARFFSYAQDVSSEQLQQLWGKILAGEVVTPGRVPLRTLELLRNMTRTEAQILLRLNARTSTDALYLHYGSGALTNRELLLAQDAGFLNGDEKPLLWRAENSSEPVPPEKSPFDGPPGWMAIRFRSGYVIRITATDTLSLVVAYQLRPSVLPLLNLVREPPDMTYLNGVVESLKAERDLTVTLIAPSAA